MAPFPKTEFLEQAGTFVATPHSDPATKKPGDIVIHPIDFDSATKNLCDFNYAIKYYPNSNDIAYAQKYKPYDEIGMHMYDPDMYNGLYDSDKSNQCAKANMVAIFNSLIQNPTTPGNIAHAKIYKQTGSVIPANAERNKLNNELFIFIFNLLQSNRSIFVYNHPQFGINWDNLIQKAKYENLDTFISEIQRSLFNAECIIRFTDPKYVALFREFGYSLPKAWQKHNITSDYEKVKEYAKNFSNDSYHQKFKFIAPHIDIVYNNLNKKPSDLSAYERFLRDYNYIKIKM